jgi:chitinase
VSSFVVSNSLAGVHFWSFDGDVDCAYNPSGPSGTCNGVGDAGALGYTKGFLNALFAQQ